MKQYIYYLYPGDTQFVILQSALGITEITNNTWIIKTVCRNLDNSTNTSVNRNLSDNLIDCFGVIQILQLLCISFMCIIIFSMPSKINILYNFVKFLELFS